jgi:hypothetical protein
MEIRELYGTKVTFLHVRRAHGWLRAESNAETLCTGKKCSHGECLHLPALGLGVVTAITVTSIPRDIV